MKNCSAGFHHLGIEQKLSCVKMRDKVEKETRAYQDMRLYIYIKTCNQKRE